jgi:hypothetical protein
VSVNPAIELFPVDQTPEVIRSGRQCAWRHRNSSILIFGVARHTAGRRGTPAA